MGRQSHDFVNWFRNFRVIMGLTPHTHLFDSLPLGDCVVSPSQHKTAPVAQVVEPKVKVWLEVNGDYVFGQGLSRMLEAVRETGSIKEAAKTLDKSYRYIWGRIKQAEESIGESLVETQVGGSGVRRSGLTPRAEELLEAFHALKERITKVLNEEFSARFGKAS